VRETVPIADIFNEFAEAEPGIYTDPAGLKSKISYILDYGNINVNVGDSRRADTQKSATVATADVETVDNSCQLEIKIDNEAIVYYIIDHVHDGQGLTHLTLSKESV
jgi:hypothetical protein